MKRWSSRRGSASIAVRARHVVVAAVGATLLIGLLVNISNAASASADNGSQSRSVFAVQREATVTVGAANTARSHRVVVTGAFLYVGGLAAAAMRCIVGRRRHSPRRRGGTVLARLRAPPSLVDVAH